MTRLKLANFRSYPATTLSLEGTRSRPVVLVGDNGAGKTNLLEALSCFAPGRGLRGAALTEMTRIGATAPWAVHVQLQKGDDRLEIGTGMAPNSIDADGEEDGAGRRLVRIDGVSTNGPGILSQHLAVLWLTPAMDRLFVESASGRRRFLDRIVLALHADHGRQVTAYERAMRERNRLFAERGAQADSAWLSALETRMAEHAVAIAAARLETVRHLDMRLRAAPPGPFPRGEIRLDGWVEDHLTLGSALETEEAFRAHLASMRKRDAAAGRTLDGPHRSDLIVYHCGKAMPASLCSTGEQKGLLIGMILAHADLVLDQTGQRPILLMDEVAAHLDPDRRADLFERLIALGCQAWMTGTDPALFHPLDGQADAFHVMDGVLAPCPLRN
ncbi:DNA replication/repair protein RecF [Iodidimonas muriae]|uniref:DNA replication/repair protein RecF n=1 Tax=Iodidimonas muriae TaxID=261467 RepID=UPI001E4C8B0C|nr:DNA replication/repair protein RecF [Iodidimonas muriae]